VDVRSVTRTHVASLAIALVATACQGSDPQPRTNGSAPSDSIAALRGGATQVSLLTAQSSLTLGVSLFTFGLVTSDGSLITGGSPQVFVARDENSAALGPFPATFHEFTAFERFPNEAPVTPLTGFYAAEVDIPETGNWLFAGVARDASTNSIGTSFLPVAESVPGQVGTEAMSVPSPVATTEQARREICTREPPDPMHSISVDDALANGNPTVVNFGTPALCTSRMCGPVVDEQLAVYEDVGADRANFIHVEIYPQHDQSRPAPAFTAWGFTSEPITLVIDRDGIIRARFEGPVTADLIEGALTPLL
jgi:hypothetical protein